MTANFTQCRYMRRSGEMCTAEAMDASPDALVVVCQKHAGRVIQMVREATAKKKVPTR